MQKEIIYIESRQKKEDIKLKIAAYVRVSTESDDQLNSLETQFCYYQNLLNNNIKWEMVDIYCDEGLSALSTDKRQDFNRMMDDARRGKVDRIITKSLSRFSRNTSDALKFVRELKNLGVSVLFEKENIDTETLSGEVLLTTFSAFAQEESLSISNNLKQATRMRMQKGLYVPPSVPYGYRLINNNMVIHEDESEIIKRIYTEFLNGRGRRTIAKKLTEDGILSPSGKSSWNESSIGEILKNERFKGDMLFQKYYTPDVMPLRDVRNKGEQPKYYVKDTHQAIITDEIFEKVQSIIQMRKPELREYDEKAFTRRIYCGECGTVFRNMEINNKIYWVCKNHNHSNCCTVKQVSEENIIELFIKMYNKLKENYEYILSPMLKALIKLNDSKYTAHKGIEQINTEIADLSKQSHTLTDLMNQGVLDSALFIGERDELNNKIRKLKAEKRILLGDEKDECIEKTENLIHIFETEKLYLTEFNKQIFDTVVEKIKVYEDRRVGFILLNGLELIEIAKNTRR